MAISSKKQFSLFKDKQNKNKTNNKYKSNKTISLLGCAKEEGIRQRIKGLNTVTKHQPTYFTIVGVPVHEAGIMTSVPGRHFAVTRGDEESAVSRVLKTCEGCFL